MDSGTAYGRSKPSCDATLVEVGPGTPGGEMLRRYWHPIAVAAEITTRAQQVRVLGEDLVLFRNDGGRPGLLYPRCCHRGTALYYGKVGRCLDMPCEPPEKNQSDRYREAFHQPWYPCRSTPDCSSPTWAAGQEPRTPALRRVRRRSRRRGDRGRRQQYRARG